MHRSLHMTHLPASSFAPCRAPCSCAQDRNKQRSTLPGTGVKVCAGCQSWYAVPPVGANSKYQCVDIGRHKLPCCCVPSLCRRWRAVPGCRTFSQHASATAGPSSACSCSSTQSPSDTGCVGNLHRLDTCRSLGLALFRPAVYCCSAARQPTSQSAFLYLCRLGAASGRAR